MLYYSRTIEGKSLSYSTSLSKKVLRIPLLFQCFKHSLHSIVSGSNCPLSQLTVRRAPEKTLSGSSLIGGIERTSIAISESLGQRCLCVSWHHHAKAPFLPGSY